MAPGKSELSVKTASAISSRPCRFESLPWKERPESGRAAHQRPTTVYRSYWLHGEPHTEATTTTGPSQEGTA
jgi:hypothetical protein